MTSLLISQGKPEFEKALSYLAKDIGALHTGRANPASVEPLKITAYGGNSMTLRELASISVPEARVLVVSPWDKTILKDIVRSITEANLGFQIIAESDKVRLVVPHLTEESRREYIKLLKEKLEKARVAVRQAREKVREKILASYADKSIAEDEKFKLMKELETVTNDYVKQIDTAGNRKTEELSSL